MAFEGRFRSLWPTITITLYESLDFTLIRLIASAYVKEAEPPGTHR